MSKILTIVKLKLSTNKSFLSGNMYLLNQNIMVDFYKTKSPCNLQYYIPIPYGSVNTIKSPKTYLIKIRIML